MKIITALALYTGLMFSASGAMAINWSKAPIACLPDRAERWDNPDQMQPCHCPPQSYCPGPNETDKWVNDTMEMPFFLAQRCCTPPSPPNCPPGTILTGYKEAKVPKTKVTKWKRGHEMLTQTRGDIDGVVRFLEKNKAQNAITAMKHVQTTLNGHTNPPSDAFLDGLIGSLDAWNNAYNNLPGRTASQLDRAHYKELKGLDNLYNAARAEKEARTRATEFVTKIVPVCENLMGGMEGKGKCVPKSADRNPGGKGTFGGGTGTNTAKTVTPARNRADNPHGGVLRGIIETDSGPEQCGKKKRKKGRESSGREGGTRNTGRSNTGREGCLLEGTVITMADGTRKKVEELALGEEILGNHGKAEIVALSRFTQHTDRMFSINGGKAFFTVEHPVLTPDGWKSIDKSVTSVKSDMKLVGELQVGDVILLEGGKEITVESIKEEVIDGGVNAYNISVGADGSFIANGFIMKGFKKMQMHY